MDMTRSSKLQRVSSFLLIDLCEHLFPLLPLISSSSRHSSSRVTPSSADSSESRAELDGCENLSDEAHEDWKQNRDKVWDVDGKFVVVGEVEL
mmetsp:Transcript_5355/g.12527  ORF Transcript_5355/g.12527 Transcript_5355/m.12527 type:complete len:93 (-) Transcript_5355:836-1114(-)|eukprot:750872-Hanusia_phi.AAC.3